VFFAVDVRRNTWVRPPRWVEVELDAPEATLSLPAAGAGTMRWGMAPALAAATAVDVEERDLQ
jgi:hypothetical protein